MSTINIVHLYPKEMNIYGDNGNLLVLARRLEWRNISVVVSRVGVKEKLPTDTHLIVGGGGQDAGQSQIADDLQKKAEELHRLAAEGVPMLMICGMYQMFGRYFKTYDGQVIPGIGILDCQTVAEPGRLIGNITTQTVLGDLVGYENHSGRTYLGSKASSLGSTGKGQGNNGSDGTEGAVQNNVFGSYLHGPVLAKSPEFADYLLSLALKQAGYEAGMAKLNDSMERLAADSAKRRPR